MALSVINQRGIKGRLRPEKTGLARDLNFFLIAFILAATAMYMPLHPHYLRVLTSLILVGLYVIYLILTCKASKALVAQGHGVETEAPLLITKLKLKNNLFTIWIQLILGLVILVAGAKGFIHGIKNVSQALGISALLLSLLIIPIATELPEKVNSILWVRKKKDTLGFGNITGAMVFQGTLLPAIGILLTPWQPLHVVETGIFITLAAAAWLRLNVSEQGPRIMALFLNGALYLLYLYFTLIH
jgi:cation:H+ antiporter